MKKNMMFLITLCLSAFIALQASGAQQDKQELELQIRAIQKVTQLIQEASQKAASDMMRQPTRSATSDSISRAVIASLEEEVEALNEQATIHALNEEQQKILQLLEQYLAQYQSYSAFFEAPVEQETAAANN